MFVKRWFIGLIAALAVAGSALAADESTITITLVSGPPMSGDVFYKAYDITDPDHVVEIAFGNTHVVEETVTLTLTTERDGPIEIWLYGTNIVETRTTPDGCIEKLYPGAKIRFDTVPASAQVTATTEPFVVSSVCEAAAVTPPPTDASSISAASRSGANLWFIVALLVGSIVAGGMIRRRKRFGRQE
jgi:hypothetical protein